MALTFTGTERLEVPSAADLFSVTTAAIMCWFRHPGASSNVFIYKERGAFNEEIQMFMDSAGAIHYQWRTPTALAGFTGSGSGFDDGVWHRLLFLRRASADFEAYVDEVSEGTDTTDPSTATVSPTIFIGNNTVGPGNNPFGGDLARFAVFKAALTVAEAESFLRSGQLINDPEHWEEMLGTSSEPDWSINQHSITISGSPAVADHAPCAPPFGLAPVPWTGGLAAAAAAGWGGLLSHQRNRLVNVS